MMATKRTQRTRRYRLSRLVPAILLVLTAVWVSVGAANASLPTTIPAHTPGSNDGRWTIDDGRYNSSSQRSNVPTFQRSKGQPLENGPAVKPAPPFSTAPSDLFVIDPHWRSP